MGVVYMAEQTEPVRRRVALKVIKLGMDTQQVVARFEAERQALAMMDHVNIARVLDAGTIGLSIQDFQFSIDGKPPEQSAVENQNSKIKNVGRPYFVMELIHGVPITKYCDDNHLTPRQRLELFVPVCQAIQHAHQKGIIHRDIKPSNVMVTLYDGKPVPKVIDFGVAKATEQKLTERTLFTQYGTMVGTLEYMSPEQAEMSALGVDTRSDIYSLGVLLYELLTGSTPLSQKRMKEVAFAEILRLIKEEEPPKPSTRLSDSGEALASISALRQTEPARLTQLMRGELDWIVMKTLEKDRNRRYETASGFVADVQRYLADEAVQACPPSAMYRFRKVARRNKRTIGTVTVLLFAVLAVVATFGWAVRERFAREAAIQAEVDLALQEAERWQEQAKWPEALSAAKRAEGLLAGTESNEPRERAAQLRKELEMVVALEAYRAQRANLINRQAPSSGYTRLFADAGIDVENMSPPEVAAQIARRPGTAIVVAGALDDWAQETQDSAIWKRLLEAARLADPDAWRSQLRQLMGQKDLDALRKLAEEAKMSVLPVQSLQLMGNALAFAGDSPASVAWLRRAHRQHPGDSRISFDLALHLAEHNSQGDSSPVDLLDALRFAEAALASRPSASMYDFVGSILFQIGRYDEAAACARKSIEIAPDHNWDDIRQGEAYKNLGQALVAQQKPDEAIPCFRKAIELEPTDWAYKGLGEAYAAQGKLDEAITCYLKAIELNPQWDWPHCNLGDALAALGKLDDAIVCYRKAIELDAEWSWPRLRLASVLNSQAWALATDSNPEKCDPAKAVNLANEAVELAPKSGPYFNTLGVAHYQSSQWKDAVVAFEKSMQLRDGGDSADWFFLAMAHWQLYQKEEARTWLNKAIEWADAHAKSNAEIQGFRAEAEKLINAATVPE